HRALVGLDVAGTGVGQQLVEVQLTFADVLEQLRRVVVVVRSFVPSSHAGNGTEGWPWRLPVPYSTIAAIQPAASSGRLKWMNVGMTESRMWSCWPSALRPIVGPRVESDAGEPASPSAPAVPMMATVASGENPSSAHSGT